ncbi:hypothetical protein OBBRIDRAFT_728233 [Obba rivulosa]|uniref:Uncharacterized protein n=1 Tax=Obba rivulosa TaxID=1052685 RepID=A0A8E2B3R0_9APHY|nr:hypothetical protein OBBRIDRAFT_728233 [Obba rivulosa]
MGALGHDQFSAPLHGGLLHSTDPNSPEMFKQNIQLIAGQVVRVQDLAQSALHGIEHAYLAGTNPIQTAAYMAALKQALQTLVELLKQTGVGALPLHPPNPAAMDPQAEQQQIAETARAVQALFERYNRMQESAGVVASLLAAPEHPARR